MLSQRATALVSVAFQLLFRLQLSDSEVAVDGINLGKRPWLKSSTPLPVAVF